MHLIPLLEYLNTQTLLWKYHHYHCSRIIIMKGCTIKFDDGNLSKIGFTIYLWDSIRNIYHGDRYIQLNDRVLTFDVHDANHYHFQYLPLFHFRGLFNEAKSLNSDKDAISLYGNYSRDRLRITNKIVNGNNKGINFRYHISIALFTFLKELILGNQSILLLWKYTTFTKLNKKKIDLILSASTVTLDVANPKQSGMTLRTFEALSHSVKLITNNQTTVRFCSDQGIPVRFSKFENGIDIDDLVTFLDEKYFISAVFINQYCIENFIKNILNHQLREKNNE